MTPSFTPNAPSAGNPGMGRGNVPFARGLMSGNLGGGAPPLARQMGGPTIINIGGQQGPPPPNQPGQVPPPGPQGGMGGGPPAMAGPQMAELFVNFLNAYMASLLNDVTKPIVRGIY